MFKLSCPKAAVNWLITAHAVLLEFSSLCTQLCEFAMEFFLCFIGRHYAIFCVFSHTSCQKASIWSCTCDSFKILPGRCSFNLFAVHLLLFMCFLMCVFSPHNETHLNFFKKWDYSTFKYHLTFKSRSSDFSSDTWRDSVIRHLSNSTKTIDINMNQHCVFGDVF